MISLTNNNLLYLPIIKLNTEANQAWSPTVSTGLASGSHAVLVDQTTVEELEPEMTNFINGFQGPTNGVTSKYIRLEQGLDTSEISNNFNLDAELTENQYIVEIDNRFGSLINISGNPINPSFIDDDNIASYYISTSPFVTNLNAEVEGATTTPSVIEGPRGTKLEFSILASLNLRTSEFLFDQVGNTTTFGGKNIKFIDTLVRVNGATTGYRVDVPVRFVKKTN